MTKQQNDLYKKMISVNKTLRTILSLFYILTMMSCSQEDPNTLTIDIAHTKISFPGVIYPQRYNSLSDRANGHHLIVWSGGGNANKALINTEVPDEKILSGLEALGAISGDNLTQAAWDDRFDPTSPEPDQHVEGTAVNIFVSWREKYSPVYELFESASATDFDFRLGGHRDLIPVWRSGCVTCLFSCPGGRTSNAVYTLRDQAQNQKLFQVNLAVLPKDGTKVTVNIQPVLAEDHPAEDSPADSSG